MKYINTFLISVLLAVTGLRGADLVSTATLTAVGSTTGSVANGNTNLASFASALHSLTFTGSILSGTNITINFYDNDWSSNTYVRTYTVTRPITYLTNLTVAWTDINGLARSRVNYNTLWTTNVSASTTVTRPMLATVILTPTTVFPLVYTFDPPLIFSSGITVTNAINHASATAPIALNYTYSPLK